MGVIDSMENPKVEKVRLQALIPLLSVIITFILSPDFYNVLPDKYAHILMGLSVAAGTLFPALLKKSTDAEVK